MLKQGNMERQRGGYAEGEKDGKMERRLLMPKKGEMERQREDIDVEERETERQRAGTDAERERVEKKRQARLR